MRQWRTLSAPFLPLAMLAACGQASEHGNSAEAVSNVPASPEGGAAADGKQAVAISIPQIAYAYDYSFRVPTDQLAKTQNAHMALCDRMGPARCHILDMQRTASEHGYSAASLKLEVEARSARSFGASLAGAVTGGGGSQTDSKISAEDLSKKIVDTQARLRAREMLAGRLTELLQTRKGTVAELIEAERGVAAVQEEIDEARSWLAEMQGRVSMSTIDIQYEGSSAGGFLGPLKSSFAAMGALFANSLAVLVQIVALLLPWAVLAGLLLFLWRRFGASMARLLRRRTPDDLN